MIDRRNRDRLALLLRRYVAGRITNDDLADQGPSRSADPAIRAVYEYAWNLYDDFSTHRAEGRHALSPEARRVVARWILFLHSDCGYRWPVFSFMQIYNWPLNILTLGWWERRKYRRFEAFQRAGHFKVWPFVRTAEYKEALVKPRFFVDVLPNK
jgi:hypothetical protein